MTGTGETRRIGELARDTQLTVRTLHYYDRLGLLSPSWRTDGGHRCYTSDDVQRLHRIIALRTLGLSLEEIGVALEAEPDNDPAAILRRQLDVVDARIRQAVDLRSRLLGVLEILDRMVEPSTTEILRIIEETMIMNQPLTPDQIANLIEVRRQAMSEFGEEKAAEVSRKRQEMFAALSQEERDRLQERLRQSAPPSIGGAKG